VNGPRILLGVLALAAVLLWTALAGGGDADLARGLHETTLAFTAVEQELAGLDGDFRALTAQSPVLGLREEHSRVRDLLLSLRDERIRIESDPSLDRRARLPRLRALVERSDQALALAVGLGRKCAALVSLREQKQPLLEAASSQQAQLEALRPAAGEAATQAAQLASSLADVSQRLVLAEHIIRQNPLQGRQFGENTLAELRQLVQQQQSLIATLR
jgi:hypothetical protein